MSNTDTPGTYVVPENLNLESVQDLVNSQISEHIRKNHQCFQHHHNEYNICDDDDENLKLESVQDLVNPQIFDNQHIKKPYWHLMYYHFHKYHV